MIWHTLDSSLVRSFTREGIVPDSHRFTPAEIQQQLIQCTDLLRIFDSSYERGQRKMFLRTWHDALVSARARYLEQEQLSEAQWNILAREGDLT